MQRVTYNERSWAIDVISRINSFINNKDLEIRRAGGENSLRTNGEVLFPDVLLFGDENQGRILQGWELKFPDTQINDNNLIENAKKKAISLNLNSFLLWNVSSAVLYVINDDETLEILRTWNDLAYINSRQQVFPERERVLALVDEIIPIINGFLYNGIIRFSSISTFISSETIFNIIQTNTSGYASDLHDYSLRNRDFSDEVTIWWRYAKNDFPDENNKFHVLARNNLFFLFNKFIFAHLLKSMHQRAFLIDNIDENSTIQDAIQIFNSISEACDFWDIFNKQMGEEIIDSRVWNDFKIVNSILKEFHIQKIDISLLQNVLRDLIAQNKRKIAGQYATPIKLAKLIVSSTIIDRNQNCLDPCCGSGTIIREIYNFKTQALEPLQSYDTTWGSDKFSFPLLIASMNLADPQAIGILRRLFKWDATELNIGQEIEFHDPYSGKITILSLPKFQYIISNLPFVRQEDIKFLNPNIGQINGKISEEINESNTLIGRSDLYSYFPFYFYDLLGNEGILTIIISNSWAGTAWGDQFINTLRFFYDVQSIIISGKGRWFKNSKVVTTVLILKKKNILQLNGTCKTKFVTLKEKIDNLNDESIQEFSALISSVEEVNEEDISIISYTNDKIDDLKSLGLSHNSFFTDNNWLLDLEGILIHAKDIFKIARGERRGWDPLFFPEIQNQIETDYLKPVLKTPRSVRFLDAESDALAFCCTLSRDELIELNHLGAIRWIESFENQCNSIGESLSEVLKRSGIHWYTLNPNTRGEFVASINYGDRLFISKFNQPTFVNQRLIRISRLNLELNIDICHALLNSILSMFYLEALGFGRGEGVLDLNKNYFEQNFHILNPRLLTKKEENSILESFKPLKEREILSINDELESKDRIIFDSKVLEIYGLLDYLPRIKKSLVDLYSIRNAVNL